MKTIAIIGASNNRQKFGNKAVRAYKDENWKVFPVNKKEQEIEGLPVYKSISGIGEPIDRVSIYLPPEIGIRVLDEVEAVQPGEVLFNPGTESEEIRTRAGELKLQFREVCSIVDIGRYPSEYH